MSKPFRFKQFEIRQDACAMKVNTDGVLLGAWSNVKRKQVALDIGTGSGVIALMLAQRNEKLMIDAVEIDQAAFQQATENFKNNAFADRLNIYHTTIQDYAKSLLSTKYDLIVSNPPYFNSGTLAKNNRKANSRHSIQLPHKELLQAVNIILTQDGHFDVIIPYTEGLQLIDEAANFQLYPMVITEVYPKINKPIERLLICFGKNNGQITINQLVIHKSDNPKDYTEDYIALTKDFYIFM
jgi:tRNA1Val (adenine37-N6)-methyltransferase